MNLVGVTPELGAGRAGLRPLFPASGSARVPAHIRRLVLAAVAISVLVSVLAPAAGAATPDEPLQKGDFAGSFGIGHGRSMYLECYGRGSPTVILDAGLRNGAAFWSQRSDETPPGPTVLPGVARFTRVCGYDRPGTILTSNPPFEFSRSSRAQMPRSAADAVSDLHTLLKVAKVPGPYVFVSQSLGGLIDRLYAATYPRQVAAMVLVDALTEYLQEPLDRAQMAAYSALNNGPVEGLDYPDLERIRFVRSFAQMRRAQRKHPLRDIPLSVISKRLPFGLPEGLPGGLTAAVLERAWHHAQDKLAKLTPGAVQVIAKRSSHYVMLTQPKLIIDQARRVVRAVRRARR
jgi:pimeloyl-ACP methyl ester carboxylesterase